jgi:hypothetical protein
MADRTIPAHPVRDPDCDLWKTRPGHVCRRRDGLLLTGTNGDCHAHAAEHARRVRHMLDELAVAGYPHPDDDLTTVLAFLEEHPAGPPKVDPAEAVRLATNIAETLDERVTPDTDEAGLIAELLRQLRRARTGIEAGQ